MAGGNCDSHLDQSGSYYRAGASCSSLSGDSEARAQLVRNWGPDYYSQWFNDLFVTYHSGWYTCWQGCTDAVQIN